MKKGFALLLVLLLSFSGLALGETEYSYEGTVVAGETVPVSVPFGGRVDQMKLHAGSWVREGDAVGTLQTTLNFAPLEGTVRGLYAEAGDTTEAVTERYGAILYIDPTHRYMLEATSEKAAMAWMLDGKVTAVIGTHTHVQTADGRILPGGTAFLSDVGMTGGHNSILGRDIPDVVRKFRTGMPTRLNVTEKNIRLDYAVVSYEMMTGRAVSIQAYSEFYNPENN